VHINKKEISKGKDARVEKEINNKIEKNIPKLTS
jgi:hypothetical protein